MTPSWLTVKNSPYCNVKNTVSYGQGFGSIIDHVLVYGVAERHVKGGRCTLKPRSMLRQRGPELYAITQLTGNTAKVEM